MEAKRKIDKKGKSINKMNFINIFILTYSKSRLFLSQLNMK